MKRLTIEQMTIQNFKGVTALTVEFSPKTTRISGMNGTGKSTLADAFSWTLFGKDSNGHTPGTDDFHEKPLDLDGQEIHNLDTMVEVRCRINGLPLNLRRLQRENWVKKRGNMDADFQGNTSRYWINDVEVKLSDFKARISEIAPEDVFRVIGMLSAFNALDWKERRKQLLAMTGDVTETLLTRKEYEPLTMECAKRGVDVDGLRKVASDQRRNINKELDMLPVRIDEAKKALDDVTPAELETAVSDIAEAESEIEKCNAAILDARSNSSQARIEREIVDLKGDLTALRYRMIVNHDSKRKALQPSVDVARAALHAAETAFNDAGRLLESRQNLLAALTAQKAALKAKYATVYEETYLDTVIDICPTCKQALPPESVEAARKAAKALFDGKRSERLLEIQAQGKDCANQIKELEGMIAALKTDATNAFEAVKTRQAAFDEAADRWKAFPAAPSYADEPRIAEIEAKIKELRATQGTTPDAAIAELTAQRAELTAKITAAKIVTAKREAAKTTAARIMQLEKEQRAAASSLAEVEKLLTLIERYVQAYCSLLEESINGLFPTLRWKLFDTQINGGITDTCICMVPCPSGLIPYGTSNTGAKINADLEIINVLSKHYEVSLPVFADNCERVNKLQKTDAQMILLTVTFDRELKIEGVNND